MLQPGSLYLFLIFSKLCFSLPFRPLVFLWARLALSSLSVWSTKACRACSWYHNGRGGDRRLDRSTATAGSERLSRSTTLTLAAGEGRLDGSTTLVLTAEGGRLSRGRGHFNRKQWFAITMDADCISPFFNVKVVRVCYPSKGIRHGSQLSVRSGLQRLNPFVEQTLLMGFFHAFASRSLSRTPSPVRSSMVLALLKLESRYDHWLVICTEVKCSRARF